MCDCPEGRPRPGNSCPPTAVCTHGKVRPHRRTGASRAVLGGGAVLSRGCVTSIECLMEGSRMPTLKSRLHVCLAVATAALMCPTASARAQRRGGGPPLPDDPAEAIQTLNGFQVSLVQRSDPQKHGSWISMNKDDRGRLILGGQRGQPLTRLTLQ